MYIEHLWKFIGGHYVIIGYITEKKKNNIVLSLISEAYFTYYLQP